jgi:RNA polymerase sigma-70 factor (ECF subfamily)
MPAGTAASRELDDDQLMLRVQRGDADAFRVLYQRHAAHAYGAARAISAERAEDAVQDGFISVWRGRARYAPCGASVAGWIVTIVRRRAFDLARAAAREPSTGAASAGSAESVAALGSVEEDAIAREDGAQLRDALKGLPAIQREVIVLAFFGGLTHRQIASRLALPEGTVKGRMRLGLGKLRRTIQSTHGRACLITSCPPTSTLNSMSIANAASDSRP